MERLRQVNRRLDRWWQRRPWRAAVLQGGAFAVGAWAVNDANLGTALGLGLCGFVGAGLGKLLWRRLERREAAADRVADAVQHGRDHAEELLRRG